ncbi:hypothetical protein Ccrd_025196 [Cynara cardunculus var. scolymus]|uniref:Uncharacterized protein n=1 Tax=Cynara cardunculus var. scolymus TaxID=59895 RepID=A0A103XB83_CYNCS|nr:hypothetical protein Ccrd_025196 [Cynara cardunculus var. scolymus]
MIKSEVKVELLNVVAVMTILAGDEFLVIIVLAADSSILDS